MKPHCKICGRDLTIFGECPVHGKNIDRERKGEIIGNIYENPELLRAEK
jgi:hypothetical protein